jgi:hypothetical protein
MPRLVPIPMTSTYRVKQIEKDITAKLLPYQQGPVYHLLSTIGTARVREVKWALIDHFNFCKPRNREPWKFKS